MQIQTNTREIMQIEVDFENSPESFLARVDYRETEETQRESGGSFPPGEMVFAGLHGEVLC